MSQKRDFHRELGEIVGKPPLHWEWSEETSLDRCEVVSLADYERLLEIAKGLDVEREKAYAEGFQDGRDDYDDEVKMAEGDGL